MSILLVSLRDNLRDDEVDFVRIGNSISYSRRANMTYPIPPSFSHVDRGMPAARGRTTGFSGTGCEMCIKQRINEHEPLEAGMRIELHMYMGRAPHPD